MKLFARTPPGRGAGRWLARTGMGVLLTGAMVAVPGTAFAGGDVGGGGIGQPPPGSSIQVSQTLGCLSPVATKTITPPGGSTSPIRADGRLTMTVDYIPFVIPATQAKFQNSNATVTWQGLSPWNATSVTLSEEWYANLASITGWSFSGAPSGTVTISSGRIKWSRTAANTYWITHGWNELRIAAGIGGINGVGFNVTGDFQFGANFFQSVTGFSSHSITGNGVTPNVWGNC